MSQQPTTTNEAGRLAALQRYQILDTPPEASFDDLAQLATYCCQAPMAAISFVDQERVWFKAFVGLFGPTIPRSYSICTYTITENRPCIIPNTTLDPRLMDNPLVVGAPGIRAYVGVPLVTSDGYAIGTLCIMDVTPRSINADQQLALQRLARQVMALLELKHEITEHRTAQAALQKSQQALALFIEQSIFAVITLDTDFRITDWNQAAERIFGFTHTEAVGRHPIGWLMSDQQADLLERSRQEILRNKQPMYSQNENLTRDGRTLICEWYSTPLVDNAGVVLCIVAMARENTKTVRTNQALQESEARFRRLFDAAPMGIVLSRPRGRGQWLYANPAALAMFGIQHEDQSVSHEILDYIAPESQALQMERFRMRAAGETPPNTYEIMGKRLDGSTFPMQVHVCWVTLPDGPANITFMTDTTESRRAKEEQENLLALLRATLDSTADAILVVDSARRILNFNQKFVEMSHAPVALLATGDEQLALADLLAYVNAPQSFLQRVEAIYAQPDQESFDRLEFNDGRIYERFSQPFRIGDKNIGRVWSFRNVTKQRAAEQALRQIEEQLHQAQKMEAIGRLAGGVAHDFNNILTIIYSACSLANRRLPADAPARRHLDDIQKAGERAAALIQQLLAFSRKQVIQPRIFSLRLLLLEMEEMLKRLVGESIQVTLAIAADLATIQADPNQLEQVLLNLAANARDAMPNGGKLTIHADNIPHAPGNAQPLPMAVGQPYVRLVVMDSGQGIDPAVLPHIFEPFFTTKAVGKGTGLGLATVYGIVQQNKGEIQIESELGRGTIMRILLPAVDALPQITINPAPSVTVAQGTETVLVVEDQENVRRTTVELLAEYGYRVLAAGSAAEAMRIYTAHPGVIDLLLTDVVMPVTDGRTLATRLRTLYPSLKVLYMSAHTEDQEVMQRARNEQNAFLQKPFTQTELLQTLRRMLDQS